MSSDDTKSTPGTRSQRPRKLTLSRRILAILIGVLVKIYSGTWRIRLKGYEVPVGVSIICLWHNRLIMPIALYKRCLRRNLITCPLSAMISASRDGSFLTAVISQFGLGAIRGSSSRRGAVALLEARRALDGGSAVAVTPDGPRGPKYVSKSGPVHLASHSGCCIIPLSPQPSRYWQLKSWDQFRIPFPFATIDLVVGDPIAVPQDLDSNQLDSWTRVLENALNTLDE